MMLLPAAARAQAGGGQGAAATIAQEQQRVIAAQTAYLLEVYALQNGGPASPEAQAELERRAAEYFTNGAKATGVPVAGPAASYFSNGAAVMAAPTSMIPDYAFAPAFPANAAASTVDAGTPHLEEGGAPPMAPPPEGGAPLTATTSAIPPAAPEPLSDETQGSVAPPSSPAEVDLSVGRAGTVAPAAVLPPSAPSASALHGAPGAAMMMAGSEQAAQPTATVTVLWAMLAGVGVGGLLVLLGLAMGTHRSPRGPGSPFT
jgi:hypothetical protein